MKKLHVAVLFGGCSPEYSVSLESAHSVIHHMNKEIYMPVMIGISQKGDWFYFDGTIDKIVNDTWCNPSDCTPAAFTPDRGAQKLLLFRSEQIESIRVDAAFPVLHGKNGEDGTVQGLIELAGIPLIGCGVLASALCMDKDRAHKLVRMAGVRVPKSVVLKSCADTAENLIQAKQMGFPLFIKPIRAGSSYGITKVLAQNALSNAVALAFQYDDQVIIEEAIDGFEVGCAVMGNDDLLVGEVDEIELSGGFFDFTEKYTLKTSAIHVPARVSKEKSDEIKQMAKVIYTTLGCRGFARVDMFLTPAGEIVFNEVNTIPGFTAHSRYPSMMKAAGLPFGEIISHLIELAVGK